MCYQEVKFVRWPVKQIMNLCNGMLRALNIVMGHVKVLQICALASAVLPFRFVWWLVKDIKLLKTKRRLLYLKSQSVPRCKHFSSRL